MHLAFLVHTRAVPVAAGCFLDDPRVCPVINHNVTDPEWRVESRAQGVAASEVAQGHVTHLVKSPSLLTSSLTSLNPRPAERVTLQRKGEVGGTVGRDFHVPVPPAEVWV